MLLEKEENFLKYRKYQKQRWKHITFLGEKIDTKLSIWNMSWLSKWNSMRNKFCKVTYDWKKSRLSSDFSIKSNEKLIRAITLKFWRKENLTQGGYTNHTDIRSLCYSLHPQTQKHNHLKNIALVRLSWRKQSNVNFSKLNFTN